VILYGSLARGAAREGSDIDLCIIKRTRKRRVDRAFELRKLIGVQKAMDVTVYTPKEVDQLRLRRPPFFVHEVERGGKVLYERPRSR
jgi:predicted nucleotidyltransferase